MYTWCALYYAESFYAPHQDVGIGFLMKFTKLISNRSRHLGAVHKTSRRIYTHIYMLPARMCLQHMYASFCSRCDFTASRTIVRGSRVGGPCFCCAHWRLHTRNSGSTPLIKIHFGRWSKLCGLDRGCTGGGSMELVEAIAPAHQHNTHTCRPYI